MQLDAAILQAVNESNTVLVQGLRNAVADWNAADLAVGDRIKGLLFPIAMPVLSALLSSAQRIANDIEKGDVQIGDMMADLQSLGGALGDFMRPVIQGITAGATTLCSGAANVVKTFLTDITPDWSADPAFIQAAADLKTAFDTLVSRIDAAGNPSAISGSVKSLGDDLVANVNNVAAAVRELQRASRTFRDRMAALGDQACKNLDPSSVATLPLDALAGLGAPQKALLDAGRGLMDAFAGALPAAKFPAWATILQNNTPALNALVDAAQKMADTAAAASQLARDITSLKTVSSGTLAATTAAVSEFNTNLAAVLPAPQVAQIISPLNGKITEIVTAAGNLAAEQAARYAALQTLRDRAVADVVAAQQYFNDLNAELARAKTTLQNIADTLVAKGEQALLQKAAEGLIAAEPYRDKAVALLKDVLKPAISALALAQGKLVEARNDIYKKLAPDAAPTQQQKDLKSILGDAASLSLDNLILFLVVAWPGPPPNRRDMGAATGITDDYLNAELKQLNGLNTLLEGGSNPSDQDVQNLVDMFTDWRNGRASSVLLANQLKEAAQVVLSGDLARVVDLEGARRRIEGKLKEMVPSKVSLTYGISAELQRFASIFLPGANSQLTIDANASYDLLKPSNPPLFTAVAELGPFDVNLFEVVTLMFNGARFVNDSGKNSDFKLFYNDFKLGPKAEFIKPLETFLNPSSSGPYVVAMRGAPGIEAGYSLDLGTIMIGSLSFANVSLNAACRLPFDNRQAIFTTSIGRRDKPFLISCLPYTGGGSWACWRRANASLALKHRLNLAAAALSSWESSRARAARRVVFTSAKWKAPTRGASKAP
jgi:hypothetical protein